ncbi:hypothetical protein KY321_00710 [Candidatus Woesearchaeota archaeon]|nr:hypothetical protein [Candidatus Woesearchaeota archaeon]
MITEILSIISILIIVYLLIMLRKNSLKIESIASENSQLIESIEKYIEIFNENNIKELMNKVDSSNETAANIRIKNIKEEYRKKIEKEAGNFSEEHETLIDFIALSLSLLIKTPKSLRKKLIDDNTDNEEIKKILISKLLSIEDYYIPVSILEIALSKSDK